MLDHAILGNLGTVWDLQNKWDLQKLKCAAANGILGTYRKNEHKNDTHIQKT